MTSLDRGEWTLRCTRRLAELRPDVPRPHLSHVALDLWLTAATDPETAAEHEVRSWSPTRGLMHPAGRRPATQPDR